MKKLLPTLLLLAVAAGFSACSTEDKHGVVVDRGLFGFAPAHAVPAAAVSPASPAATPTQS